VLSHKVTASCSCSTPLQLTVGTKASYIKSTNESWDVTLCHWVSDYRRFESTKILRNVGKDSLKYRASHLRGPESSATPLWASNDATYLNSAKYWHRSMSAIKTSAWVSKHTQYYVSMYLPRQKFFRMRCLTQTPGDNGNVVRMNFVNTSVKV
jgi:hypothetical protein